MLLFKEPGTEQVTEKGRGLLSRQVIAEAVKADPHTYNEAFLGKPTAEYARWILDASKWGGAIELSILSK